MTPHWTMTLAKRHACAEAVEWARRYPSLTAAWRACDRGDWMLWWAGQLCGPPESESRKRVVLATCACARLALRHVPTGDRRPLVAIQTAERWAKGDRRVSLDAVRRAAAAAYAAAAADAAAYASASAAAYASASAAAVAYASGAAAASAYATKAAAAIRPRTLARCATLVRRYYPRPPRPPAGRRRTRAARLTRGA